MNLLMLVATGMAEVVTLVANGMGNGAMKIVRGVVETAINAEYMRQFPDQSEKYMEWHWVELHKLYVHKQENSPESMKDFPADKRAAEEAGYHRVRGRFQNENTTRDGSKKLVMQDSWCRDNLFERAQKVNMAESYRTVMPAANQILHGSIGGWIRELDEANGRIEWPPDS